MLSFFFEEGAENHNKKLVWLPYQPCYLSTYGRSLGAVIILHHQFEPIPPLSSFEGIPPPPRHQPFDDTSKNYSIPIINYTFNDT